MMLLTDPQALNSYSYGKNNPIRYKDPEGLAAVAALPILAPLGPAGWIVGGVILVVGTAWLGYETGKTFINFAKQTTPQPGDIQGKSPEEVGKIMKEKGWTGEPTRQGGGTRYPNPDKPGEQVRIQPGNPNDPNPVKQGPYGRISSDGKVSPPIPLKGNPTLP